MKREIVRCAVKARMESIEKELEERVRKRMALKAEEASSKEIDVAEKGLKAVKSGGEGEGLIK